MACRIVRPRLFVLVSLPALLTRIWLTTIGRSRRPWRPPRWSAAVSIVWMPGRWPPKLAVAFSSLEFPALHLLPLVVSSLHPSALFTIAEFHLLPIPLVTVAELHLPLVLFSLHPLPLGHISGIFVVGHPDGALRVILARGRGFFASLVHGIVRWRTGSARLHLAAWRHIVVHLGLTARSWRALMHSSWFSARLIHWWWSSAVFLRSAVPLNLGCRVHALGRGHGTIPGISRICPHVVWSLMVWSLRSTVLLIFSRVHPRRGMNWARVVGAC